MKRFSQVNSPIILPIVFFIMLIGLGSVFLHFSEKGRADAISWTDAVFTATSATCVTGLSVVDTGSYFTTAGQAIIMGLIQVGGLGIMTFTSLSIYLLRRRTTISDRITVGRVLLHDSGFNLGTFLIDIVIWSVLIEVTGAGLLYLMAPESFSPFSSLFHSISAFCNAGFSLFSNNLVAWKGRWDINLVFMMLIIIGGMGFSVFVEVKNVVSLRTKIFFLYWGAKTKELMKQKDIKNSKKSRGLKEQKEYPHSVDNPPPRISWYARIVFQTTVVLIVLGWIALYISEFVGYNRMVALDDALLTALFQSVTSRTAGFNTLDIAQMTNVSLLILLVLMFIGGAPGSCAGGIKVTTFSVLFAAIRSQIKGRQQVVIGKFAINESDVKKAMILFVLSSLIILIALFLLDFTEGGDKPHLLVRGQFLELLFESVSAFCTVGLSTGVTPTLSVPGKWVIIILMFLGRLGPFVLINALQSVQDVQLYTLPEEKIMIG